jgi:DMSO/TMAO reductase YedYZ heme-binding membrane subunit
MVFLVSLIVAVLIAMLFKKPMQRAPLVFYLVALVLVIYYVYAYYNGSNTFVWRYLLVVFQRCTLALAFLTIVMFIGVLSTGSWLHNYLMPVRRQLSIIGCLLALGHIIVYIGIYLERFAAGFLYMNSNMAFALALALILTVLLVTLLITSFTQIRLRMKQRNWKRIQRLSYPFYLLIYVHIVLIMLPSVLAGVFTITLNIALYTVLFAAYTLLRVARYRAEKRDVDAAVIADQGLSS